MPASKSLKDILGYISLTGLVQANVPDLPNVLPDAFRKDSTNVAGMAGRYTRGLNNRTTARLNKAGAPATPVNLLSLGEFDVRCLYSYEFITLDPWFLLALRNYTDYNLQERGRDEVARQVSEFKRRFNNLRMIADIMVLSRGKIWQDANGNLLPSSSGALITSDFGIPAAQLGASIATLTGIAGAWTSAGTDIPTQLREIKRIAQRAHGYEPMCVFYGRNVPAQLAGNNALQPYLARSKETGFRADWLQNSNIQPEYDLLGFKWFPADQAFWKDQNGATQEIVDNNALIFTPKPDKSWWDHMEGEGLVPTSIQPTQDLSGSNDSFKSVHGQSSWALQQYNPVSITMYAQDVFTPVIKVPEVVYSLTSV